MVALDKAEKQVAEYQSKLEAMNNELTKSGKLNTFGLVLVWTLNV